jgi:hypothetical protein
MTTTRTNRPNPRPADIQGVKPAEPPKAQREIAIRICRAAASHHRAITRHVVELDDAAQEAWPLIVAAWRRWDPAGQASWPTWVGKSAVRDLYHVLDKQVANVTGCTRTALDVATTARRRLDKVGTPVTTASLTAATAAGLRGRGLRREHTLRTQAAAVADAVLGFSPPSLDAMPVEVSAPEPGPEERVLAIEAAGEAWARLQSGVIDALVARGRRDLAALVRRAVQDGSGELPANTLAAIRGALAAAA